MKKLICMSLSLILLLTTVASANPTRKIPYEIYKDVDGAAHTFCDTKGKDCQKAVSLLVANGVLYGHSDGTFRAENDVSKGVFAKMLLMAMQMNGSSIKADNKGKAITGANAWLQYVTPLIKLNIIKESDYAVAKFPVGMPLTRGEACKWLVSAYLYANRNEFISSALPTCDDATTIDVALRPYVASALELGLMQTKNGKFDTNAIVSRGDAAIMIYDWLFKTGIFSDFLPSATSKFRAVKLPKTDAPSIDNVVWAVTPQAGLAEPMMEIRMHRDGLLSFYYDKNHSALVDPRISTMYYLPQNVTTRSGDSFFHGYTIAFHHKGNGVIWEGIMDCEGNWLSAPSDDYWYSDFQPWLLTDGKILWICQFSYNNGEWVCGTAGAIDSTGKRYTHDEMNALWKSKVSTVLGGCDQGNEYSKEEIKKALSMDGAWCDGGATTAGLAIYSIELARNPYPRDANGIINLKTGEIVLKAKLDETGREEYGGLSTVYDDCIVMRYHVNGSFFDGRQEIYDGTTGKLLYLAYEKPESGSPCRLIQEYGEGLFCYWETENLTNEQANMYYSNSLCGYMDKYGKTVIPPSFSRCEGFDEGYACVAFDGKFGIIKLPNFEKQ